MTKLKDKGLVHKTSAYQISNVIKTERMARKRALASKAAKGTNRRSASVRYSNGATGRNLPKPITNTGGSKNNGDSNNN